MLLLSSVVLAATPATLLAKVRGDELPTCGTELVRQVKDAWSSFSPDEQAELDRRLSPPGHSLAGRSPAMDPHPVPPPDAFPSASCWGPQMGNVVTGSHFQVEWEDGEATETNAGVLLEALELSWQTEVEELGWNATVGSDEYLLPVYITADYSNGAYTTVDYCGGTYQPYIVVGANSFYDTDWLVTAASHEFNHAIQFSTSYAPEPFWWEATATYIEHLVYPSIPYWSPYLAGYTDNPQLRINADGSNDYDEFNHMYGMAVFGFYLEDYQGGSDVVRQMWESAESERGYYSYTIQEMVEAVGVNWDEAYLDFITRNTVMEYEQHRYMPDIDTIETVESLPATGEPKTSQKPEGYGQNYIVFSSDAGEGDLSVTVAVDSSYAWEVVLAEVDRTSVLRSVNLRIEADVGEGTIVLPDFGGNDAVMVISPLSDTTKGQDYSWSAEFAAPEVVEDTGDDKVAEEPTGEDPATACGCAVGGAATPGVALLLGLLALRRRRA